ncbi:MULTISPECIES: hypothetical protein [Methylobacteriaceae]|uniref:hypothetical protein n=1 Tax=Methylobacteriaceae TaxID=119045 RepID=UPI00074F89F2|nr:MULTISPECIES: hypothetical protein [Methylobacteriaceae]AMB47784.1 hypothetical protein Y590_22765 [Methylobacterium sp. AMS5]TFZ59398.1 hypothetical protein E4V01_08105 [Methylorubrum sp. Q1]
MPVVLRSLSDFKKFLRKPGATLQIVQNTFVDRQDAESRAAYRRKGLYEPRTLRAISKKAAVFDVKGHETTVWLYWDRGTRHWRFSGDTVTVPLNAALGPPDAVVYRCTLPQPSGQRRSASERGDDEAMLPGL